MRLVMLHCLDIGSSLSCNSIVRNFLITFTPYMNKQECGTILASLDKLDALYLYLKIDID